MALAFSTILLDPFLVFYHCAMLSTFAPTQPALLMHYVLVLAHPAKPHELVFILSMLHSPSISFSTSNQRSFLKKFLRVLRVIAAALGRSEL